MHGRAIDAEEHSIGHRSPRRVLRTAIKAHLVLGFGLELPEHGGLVGETVHGHDRSVGRWVNQSAGDRIGFGGIDIVSMDREGGRDG